MQLPGDSQLWELATEPSMMGGGARACTALLQGQVCRAMGVGHLIGGVGTVTAIPQRECSSAWKAVEACASCRAMQLPMQYCCRPGVQGNRLLGRASGARAISQKSSS